PDADGVVACSRPAFNPFYVGVVAPDRYIAPAFPGVAHTRRQDVPEFLRINGALFVWRTEFLRRTPDAWLPAGKHLPLEIPELRAFSIDDAAEFALAELVLAAGLVRLPWLPVAK
ncbi:MAG: acylneuraminate cytidylyltransferase family protein, partial [Kofleriaceae bacterium]